MFDLTSVAVADTSDVELTDAAGEPLLGDDKKPLLITVYGPGSDAFAKAQARRQNKAIDRMKKKGKTDISAQEQIADIADFLAMVTVSFNGFTYPPAGKASGYDLFHALYADPTLGFIRDQVNLHCGDWANFTKASAKS